MRSRDDEQVAIADDEQASSGKDTALFVVSHSESNNAHQDKRSRRAQQRRALTPVLVHWCTSAWRRSSIMETLSASGLHSLTVGQERVWVMDEGLGW